MEPIYLDHNATTPLHPAVLEAMLPWLREHFGNPSSGHAYGQRARRAVERAREQVAALLCAQPDEIVFTSGGTEASNLAIRGVLSPGDRRGVVTTVVEHPATLAPCALLEREGRRVVRLPVDGHGLPQEEAARAAFAADPGLLTVMLAQNETGTLLPVARLAARARARGALVHCDAAQAVGKVPVGVDALGVDLLTVAGHKLYAPKGVGALYVRRGVPLAPLVLGAGQERGMRPGTENVASVVGLGAACALAAADLAGEGARQAALRDALWEALRAAIPGLARNGHPDACLPNTLNVSFPGVRGGAVLAAAPEVAASTGSACHEGCERPSGVLLAMGLASEAALGAVRLSLGRGTDEEAIGRAAAALVRAFAECGR